MTTLTRERRKKFEEIITNWILSYGDAIVVMPSEIKAVCQELADAASGKNEVRGIEWAIARERPVTEEDMEEKTIRAACNEFESALGCGQFPWDSTAVWTKFRKWVVEVYRSSPALFREYNLWRDDDKGGKFGDAMKNPKIRENPEAFMTTGWATFLAKTRRKTDTKVESRNLND